MVHTPAQESRREERPDQPDGCRPDTRHLRAFDQANDPDRSKVFNGADFGYSKVTVERPLRIAGVDPERVCRPPKIRKLKEDGVRDEELHR